LDSRVTSKSRRSRSRESRRSRSPRRSNRDSSTKLDSKSLGFGNTRGLTQDDLKLFSDTLKQFKNIMEGIIASCEIEKQSSDMFCEMNTNKIVLDFLRFLRRYEKSM
jgi:hypothetical protein